MKRSPLSLVLFLLFLVCFAPSSWAAEEVIHRFDVTATVHKDASVTLVERILLTSLGQEIRRGIIRVFPTDYTGPSGRIRTGFQLHSAMLDGRRVPASVERVGGNLEIRLGDPRVFVQPGEHTYEIEYRTTGWIGFYEDHDELYWNVTGNDWIFPIERASFLVVLPDGAATTEADAFTGWRGDTGKEFVRREDGSFETTRRLEPGEGFTVAVAWDKGVVTAPEPTALERLRGLLVRYRILVMSIFPLLFLGYFYPAWRRKGKDPAGRPIIPLFEPPDGIEPGFARYFRTGQWSTEVLAADILHLAVRGAVSFEDRGGTTVIHPSEKPSDDFGLSDPLRSVLDTLRRGDGGTGVPVDESGGATFHLAGELQKGFYKGRAERYERSNLGTTLFGALLFVPMVLLACFMGFPLASASGLAFTLIAISIIVFSTVLIWFALSGALRLFRGHRSTVLSVLRFALTAMLAFSGGVWLTVMAPLVPHLVVGFSSAVMVFLFFARIMPARTEKGARLAEGIEGLAMYIGTAESARLAMVNPPEETPTLFEKLLPYAFALGLAETWANRFSDILERANYRPTWQQGYTAMGSGPFISLPWFTNSLTRNVQSAVSSHQASMAKTTSYSGGRAFGGRSGGGFSGGGGGGGGGRGW